MKSYDLKKPIKFIIYLDANNLYGWATSQYLPYGEFKWLNKKQINKFDVNSIEFSCIEENSSIGYIFEVELEYLVDLYDLHNDYPLAPEKLKIIHDMRQIIVVILQMSME